MQNNTAIIRLSAIGDVALTLPLIQYLSKTNSNPLLLTYSNLAGFTKFFPSKTLFFDSLKQIPKILKYLKTNNYSRIIDLQGKIKSKLLLQTAKLYGFETLSLKKRDLKDYITIIKKDYPLKLKNNAVWKNYFFFYPKKLDYNKVLTFPFFKNEKLLKITGTKIINRYSKNKKTVLIHPEAKNDGKKMTVSLFNFIIHTLNSFNITPFIIGDKNTVAVKHCYKAIDLRGKTNFEEFLSLIKVSDTVITTDSAPMHIAALMKKNIVAFYFQTSTILGFSPFQIKQSNKIILFDETLNCKPCDLHGKRKCPLNNWKCKNIDKNKLHEILSQITE